MVYRQGRARRREVRETKEEFEEGGVVGEGPNEEESKDLHVIAEVEHEIVIIRLVVIEESVHDQLEGRSQVEIMKGK